jgi:predicted metal-dependent enzyme (double-stranded beta helix superfamily)
MTIPNRGDLIIRMIDQLNIIDWSDDRWRDAVSDILADSAGLSDSLTAYMRSWDTKEISAKFNGSHITGTHYKLLVYREQGAKFTVWLHTYKSEAERGHGYAEVPHNHRYDLCSIILNGGYESVLYEVADNTTVLPKEASVYNPGDVLSLTHHQVHSLTAIREGTQTLFVEGPTITNFSTSYPPGGPPREHYDFYGLVNGFLAGLKDGI